MSKFFIPARITNFSPRSLSLLNYILRSIEGQLQLVPLVTFNLDRVLLIPAGGVVESTDNTLTNDGSSVYSISNTVLGTGYASINIPDGATVTALKVYWNRNDAVATGDCDLIRADFNESETIMATADSNASTGFHSVTDTTITNAVIDYDNYMYYIKIVVDPNDNKTDVKFLAAEVTYTLPT
jgi:hypothetical protein